MKNEKRAAPAGIGAQQRIQDNSASSIVDNPFAALWSTRRVAEFLSCEEVTLRSWRRNNIGPPFIRISARQVKYRPQDVERWLENRKVGA